MIKKNVKFIINLIPIMSILAFSPAIQAELPNPGVQFIQGQTALLVTDPPNDFLSPSGVTWGVVGKSVIENNTVENIDTLLKTAKQTSVPVFISPHYYQTGYGWKFEGGSGSTYASYQDV